MPEPQIPNTVQVIGQSTSPAEIRRIVLTGFMGAGKTTVGNLLARRLAWSFVDVDEKIEAGARATIAQLFAERGEPWFRQLEHETIRELLNSESLVLALGGGAIEDEHTRSLMLNSEGTWLVHLEASLETVLNRCQGTESLRPILQDKANLEARYLRRLPLYRQAHLTVAVDAMHPSEAANAILDHLGISTQA
jgi:shikimate kinase